MTPGDYHAFFDIVAGVPVRHACWSFGAKRAGRRNPGERSRDRAFEITIRGMEGSSSTGAIRETRLGR